MSGHPVDRIETSLKITIGIVVTFFLLSIIVVLEAPRFVDSSWLSPSSRYQVQMYEISDPNMYISNSAAGDYNLQHVQHVVQGKTLFAYVESDRLKLIADEDLVPYITNGAAQKLKLTHRLLFLREPSNLDLYQKKKEELAGQYDQDHPLSKGQGQRPSYEIFELYDPQMQEAFIYSPIEGALENWVDKDFIMLNAATEKWHEEPGVLYVPNPQEYRIKEVATPIGKGFAYDANGRPIKDLAELTGPMFNFSSRKELIEEGERIYAIEGCWYCHTDQTRTLVQDVVLNGSDSYPAPPSSANEYIYQNVTFPGTRRIGPDMSRVGVKRPSRDWHKSHFWAPKTISPGSIMPSFHHFFDDDPRGTRGSSMGVPNHLFESIYQYLMTKGTRITPPTEAWWLGKDPVRTKELIEDKHAN